MIKFEFSSENEMFKEDKSSTVVLTAPLNSRAFGMRYVMILTDIQLGRILYNEMYQHLKDSVTELLNDWHLM